MPNLHVSSRIHATTAKISVFVIAGGNPNGEVSWQVRVKTTDAKQSTKKVE